MEKVGKKYGSGAGWASGSACTVFYYGKVVR